MRFRDSPAITRRAYLPRLLQTVCLSCGQWVPADARLSALCDCCFDALPWNESCCDRCALPATWCSTNAAGCSQLPFTSALAPLRYNGWPARWVIRAKRHGGLPETKLLGLLLALAAGDALAGAVEDDLDFRPPDLLIPVPLSWRRQLWRGHNQALLLCHVVADQLALRYDARAVRRHQHTGMQPGRSAAAREANVAGAFSARRSFQGEHVVVIDDVMTSAATAAAVSQSLLDAGAGRVDVWCATRALPS